MMKVRYTVWKVSKYGVISGPYFPVFGVDTGKYGPKISSYLDTFHARYGISFPSKNTLNYAKIMNSKNFPHFSFQQKIDYGQTLSYTWAKNEFSEIELHEGYEGEIIKLREILKKIRKYMITEWNAWK